jgi:hypothetical protein
LPGCSSEKATTNINPIETPHGSSQSFGSQGEEGGIVIPPADRCQGGKFIVQQEDWK